MATIGATLQIYDRFSSPLKDYASGLKSAAQASSGLKGAVANAVNGMSFQKPKSELDQLGNQVEKTGGLFKTMLGANVIGTGISKAIGAVTSSIGDAVKRVDTLNNASRAFENMGFSAKETKGAMTGLDKSISGLPTSMDVAVKNTQLLAASTGDIGKSVSVFKAMNDGILGFGGTSAQVENAVVQLSQAFSNGKVDAETWNSMIDSGMGPSLNALAKTMGKTTGQFKEGLSKGTISVGTFQDALIDLDKNGGGGMKSLNQIAKDSTAGFATSMTNMKTAVTRGVAGIINGFSKGGLVEFMNKITDGIKAMVPTFEAFGSKAGQVFSRVVKGIGEFWQAFKNTGAVTAIMGAFYSIKGAINAIMSALKSTDGKSLFTIKNAAEAVGNAVVWAANQVDNFATFIQRLDPNVIQAIATAAGIALTIFMGWKAITGVIGGVSGAIKGLSGAFTGIGSAMRFVVKHPILSTIILLAGAFVYAYATSEKFRDGVSKIAGAIGKAVSAISDWIGKNKGMASGMAWGTAYGVIIFALYKKFQLLKNPLSAVSGLLKTFGKAKSSGLTKIAEDASKTTGTVTSLKSKLSGGLNFAIKAVGVAAVIGSLALLAKSLEGIANAGAQAPANLATFGAVVAGLAGTFALFGGRLQSSAVGIAVFAGSMSILALALAPIANAGAGAAANMAVFGAVVGGLAIVFAVFGTALTAAIPAMLIFGVTMLLIGVAALLVGSGIMLATMGMALLATQLPMIAAYGTSAAVGLLALGAAAIVFGVGALIAGIGLVILGAGLLVVGVGATIAAVGMLLLGAATMIFGIGLLIVSAAIMIVATGFMMIASVIPTVAAGFMLLVVPAMLLMAVLPIIGVTLLLVGAAGIIAGVGLLLAGTGALVAGAGMLVLAAGIAAVGIALVVLAAGIMALYTTIASIFSQIVSAVSSAMNNVVSAVSNGIHSAISAVKNVAGSLVSAGRDFVMGFVNGIKGAVGAAADAAASMAKSAMSAAKKFLGIHSPSRLMRDEVGYYVGAGMAVGINNSASLVSDSAVNMAQDAYASASNISAPTLDIPTMAAMNVGDVMANGFMRAANALDILIGKLIGMDGVDANVTGSTNVTQAKSAFTSDTGMTRSSTNNSSQTVNFNFGDGSIVVQTNGSESGEELLEKIAAAAKKYSDKGLAF
ncbi:tape measure protein [Leuconostoc gasicomitatum]|uniref:tape measure protein n=1 Tax=Leuconostoc gasicomitatum TaxID=115778 RepID=UPI001CC4AC9E|nr:tape measure protein [Leuconostoc gasicomitatum]